MAQEIKAVIDEKGVVSLDLEGFHGKGCKAVADAFNTLGRVTHEELKPSFNEGGGSSTVSVSH